MTSPSKVSHEESIILEEGDNDDEIDDPPEQEPIHVEETISVEENIALSDQELAEKLDECIKDPQSKCSAIVIQEQTQSNVTPSAPPFISATKEIPTIHMQLDNKEIETMISQGTLEVSKGHYQMKAKKLKSLKICADLTSGEKVMPIKVRPCPLSKKPKGNEPSSQLALPPSVSFLTSTPIETKAMNSPITSNPPLARSSFVQPTPSYIALMPVNQASGNTGVSSTLLALPMQQNLPGNISPTLPTLVALSSSNIVTSTVLPQGSDKLAIVSGSSSSSVTHSLPQEPLQQAPISTQMSPSSSMHSSNAIKGASISTNPSSGSGVTSGTKRKPHFEHAKLKQPYKYAKPIRKRRKTSVKTKNFVSDLNSSSEDDLDSITKSRVFGMELASMFFKKIGEPQKKDKSLLDKLHKAIFEDSLDLQSEIESEESDVEAAASEITSNSSYKTVTCPGPGQFETFIGPGQNSKLSIIRSSETKVIKNFMYEVYKVRVASAEREANTNILIPIPEGHKFQVPKGKEECIEFSHLPHEDPAAMNSVSPIFLEKLAATELKLRRYKDEIKALRYRYLELLQEYADRPQFSTISDLVGAAAKYLTEDQLVFFVMQLKAGAHNMQGIRYSVREKVLALSIYQRSPEVYKWFRRLFNLPSKRVLDHWLEDVGSQDPQLLKKLMYYVYATYNFKAVN